MSKQNSNTEVVVEMKLKCATSLLEFVTSQKNRRMKQPYWLANITEDDDGSYTRTFDFCYINEDTDVKELKLQIEHGIVYIQPLYMEAAQENFPNEYKSQ